MNYRPEHFDILWWFHAQYEKSIFIDEIAVDFKFDGVLEKNRSRTSKMYMGQLLRLLQKNAIALQKLKINPV